MNIVILWKVWWVFDLKSLFKLCEKKLDLLSVVNIGLDVIINLQILHNNGYVHRDLKPDNLAFGPLCFENLKYKNRIGILDFGNSKILHKKNGRLNYSNGKKGCFNKCFSSNNALLEKDLLPYDDIESVFYIMIIF